MCGLVGIAAIGKELDEAAALRQIERMNGCLRHRGPDGAGTWHDRRMALGHRRLAVLDLSDAGAQPMTSPSGRYVVVFNGEIYNHRSLGSCLEQTGWRPGGHSDTEVLLAAVDHWGLDGFLERADGMFAFALYDQHDGRLSLVRDRFGEKPLVYAQHERQVYFSSEVRSFTALPGFDHTLDAAATADYFRYSYIPGDRTILRGVRRVPPATIIEFDLTGRRALACRRYWTPGEAPPVTPDGDVEAVLLERLSTSVRTRLVSDRPIGAFLSGGIDSSLICALAAPHVSGSLSTFTMGWEVAEYDESEQAARVANALGTDHHDVRLGRSEVVAAVERLGAVMDEPFADSSQLAVLLVAAFAREHVVVALSGDGGDELFGGYNRHRWLLATRGLRDRVPQSLRRPLAAAAYRSAPAVEWLAKPIPVSRRPRLVADKVRKLAGTVAEPSLEGAYQTILAFDQDVGEARHLSRSAVVAMAADDDRSLLWGIRVADLQGQLPDDMLTKIDRATMSVSLESRAPFLQPEVAQLALSLGPEELLGPSGGKQVLRRALTQLLPAVDFSQPKTGFGVPLASLLRAELRPRLADAMVTHVARKPPVALDWAALAQRLDRGDDAPAALLWSLLMFELWAATLPFEVTWR